MRAIKEVVGMILIVMVCLLMLQCSKMARASTLQLESYYQDQFCTSDLKPITNTTHNQYRLSDGKVADCIAGDLFTIKGRKYAVAFEIDFTRKGWTEAVGQALHYAQQASFDLGRSVIPGIAVIVETASDCADLSILYSEKLNWVIIEIGPYAYKCF